MANNYDMNTTGFVSELDNSNKKHIQPESLKVLLKPHQLTILYKAIQLENTKESPYKKDDDTVKSFITKFGILCDKVGAGKSLEILSIIASNSKFTADCSRTYSIPGLMSYNIKSHKQEDNIIPTNIIVVPHSVIEQWVKYIADFTSLTFFRVHTKKQLNYFESSYIKNNNIQTCNIVLVSSTRYKDFLSLCIQHYKTKKVLRFIVDEADFIKIPNFQFIPASFYWFMTSSYTTLQYPNGKRIYYNENNEIVNNWVQGVHSKWIDSITSKGELYRIFMSLFNLPVTEFIRRKIYSKIFLKNNDDYVKASFDLIEPEIFNIKCRSPVILNVLNNIINNTTLQMINAGDIKGAMEAMNCYKVEHKNLIETVTEELNIELKNKKIEYDMKSKMVYSTSASKKNALKVISEAIDKIQNKINLLTERIKEHEMCSICFDSFENKTLLNCCHSAYCFECVSCWLANNNKCPMCRHPVSSNNMIIVDDSFVKPSDEGGAKHELETKLENIKKIISKRKVETGEQFKFLIFTEYDRTFDDIEIFLDSECINYGRIMGSVATIKKKIDNFRKFRDPNKSVDSVENRDIIDCLLLNSKFCGNGINLENATDVFIYHKMNEDMTNQIIGRAQRPGRTSQLKIWMLQHENE
jgi:SNF2 family DNA or RNA helicase